MPAKKNPAVEVAAAPGELIAKAQQGELLTANELGIVCDYHREMRVKRLLADKVAEDLKSKEDSSYAVLVAQMLKQKISAAGGKYLKVSLPAEPSYKPTVTDWPKFYAYIYEHKAFELLQKRPGEAAIKERWDADEDIPGIAKFPVYKLSRSEVK